MTSFTEPTSLSADVLQPQLDRAAQEAGLSIAWESQTRGSINQQVSGVDVTGTVDIQPGAVVVSVEAAGGEFDGIAVEKLQPAVHNVIVAAQNAAALQEQLAQGQGAAQRAPVIDQGPAPSNPGGNAALWGVVGIVVVVAVAAGVATLISLQNERKPQRGRR